MPNLLPVIVPLISLIVIGYGLGRFYKIDLQSIGAMLIFVVTPIVAFGSTAQLDFRHEYILLPIVSFILACATGLMSRHIGKFFLRDKSLNAFLPASTGTANTGYLGLPIIMAVFSPEWTGVYFLIILGLLLFENSVGYYFIARHNQSMRDGIKKVLKLPAIYAMILGIIFSAYRLPLDNMFTSVLQSAKGAYVFCGMMLVGIALASYKKLEIHKDLLAITMIGRYGVWIVVSIAFIWFDVSFLHIFNESVYKMLIFIGILPVAANLTAIAAQCNYKPEVAAPLVIITSIVSFILIVFILPTIMSLSFS